jgi:hypothetical protein
MPQGRKTKMHARQTSVAGMVTRDATQPPGMLDERCTLAATCAPAWLVTGNPAPITSHAKGTLREIDKQPAPAQAKEGEFQ